MDSFATGSAPKIENPWYVLMTLYEMRGNVYPPEDVEEKNRKFWNAWVGKEFNLEPEVLSVCSAEQRAELGQWDEIVAELNSGPDEYRQSFRDTRDRLLALKAISSINLNQSEFNRSENFEGYIFPIDVTIHSSKINGHLNFSGALFCGALSCLETNFQGDVSLHRAQLRRGCNFAHCQFGGKFIFSDVALQGDANFDVSTFEKRAYFSDSDMSKATFNLATFKSVATFTAITFKSVAQFEASKFLDEADFVGSSFKGFANFKTATFQSHAYFSQTNFSRGSFFQGTTFKGFTYFTNASFTGEVEHDLYETAFTDCQFEKTTSFEGATFRGMYPKLRGTTLHETTSFTAEKTNWPSTIDSKPQAALAKETCSVIRHNLAKQGFPEKEHFFFRREMEATGKSQDLWKNLPYRFFGVVSDYGHSILRPCLFLLGLWIIPAFIYLWTMTWSSVMGGSFAVSLRAFGFSFANIFKFLGFQKTYFVKEFETLNPWLDFLSAGQTVFGFVFLFFLGLGLRQRFRLR